MWKRKLSIQNLEMAGKRVLIRVDFDVQVQKGKVTNNKKIVSALDSIVLALVKEAKSVVIISHLGKPRGIRNMKYSLTPVAEELDILLKHAHTDPKSLGKYSEIYKLYSRTKPLPNVKFFQDCCGSEIENLCEDPMHGSIYMLENLRFHTEEEGCGKNASGNKVCASTESIDNFRKSIHKLGDVFVNDAFSLCHKTHSSILGEGFEKRAAGLILDKEITHFRKVITHPDKPYLAILGGIRIIDKLKLIDNLLDRVSEMIIGGAMAFPFLKKLKRMDTGHSLFDVEGSNSVKIIMKKAKRKKVNIYFPTDFMASSKSGQVQLETVRSGIGEGWMGLDIGPESCSDFRNIIMRAKTIVWTGPVGAYELDNFGIGTESVLLDVAKATSRGSHSILIGEDIAACAEKFNQDRNFSLVSSGGQAGKAILEGNLLPGITALSDYDLNLEEKAFH